MDRPRALVVDRDPGVRSTIRDVLEEREVVTRGVASGAEALEALRSAPAQLVFLALDTPGASSAALIDHALRLRPAPIVVGLRSSADDVVPCEFIRAGGFDLIAKPLDEPKLRMCAERAVRQLAMFAELDHLRRELRSREGYDRLVGHSAAMERLRAQVETLALNDASVWFEGEEGSGKELTARTLHASSARAGSPFVVVNCAELARGVSERDWLRAEAGGAFPAPMDQASDGSLYFDEVTQLAPDLQAQLLNLLEAAAPKAGSGRRAARLFAGSSRDARREIEQGRLLDRLHRRLAEATLSLPPLRDRTADVPLLARHFISTIVAINQLPPIELSPEALSSLERHTWPGNVQELRNAIEHAVILASGGVVRLRDLPDRVREPSAFGAGSVPSGAGTQKFRQAKRDVVERFERAYLSDLLDQHGGNVTSASQQAGMLRSALQRLLRKHGLKSATFRKGRAALSRKSGSAEIRSD